MGETMKVRITLLEEMLGTLPGDKEVYASYIATKAPNPSAIMNEEIEAIDFADEYEKGITVFPRNKDGEVCIYDYLVKGFFKNACAALRDADGTHSKDLKAYKKKIDNLVFVGPRFIKVNYEGSIGLCERPLRASTAQGERVALACSESVPAESVLEFEVTVLAKGMLKYVIEWLDYGKFNGLGCWHNSGKGKFTWEDITDEETAAQLEEK